MKTRMPVVPLSVSILLVLFSCKDQRGNGKLFLGEDLSHIVIPDEADGIVRFAATELRDYLDSMTGINLRIIHEASVENKMVPIRLKLIEHDTYRWDGYGIETGRHGIVISAGESRGLLYGVYTLLEEAGCSFFYPGEEEEVVPRMVKVVFRYGSRVYNPLLEDRGLAPYGLDGNSVELGRNFIDWMAKNRMNYILVSEDRPSDCAGPAHASIWKEVGGELLPELQKRGFIIEMSEHCTHVFFPRTLFDEHPGWFALNDGVRKLGEPPYSGQMCYSNEDAVAYYGDAIAGYAANHSEFHVIGTWPLDGGSYCECEACKDPLTVFNAAKRVAEKVHEVRPDMMVEHLAYKPQTWQPPAENIPANMTVLWCPDFGMLEELVVEWVERSKQGGGVYKFEYYMGDNYRSRANVWLRPAFSAKLAQEARETGYRGVVSLFLPMQNWWRASFNNWFFARACWDEQFDVDAGLHDHCRKYYGKQADDMERIFGEIFSDLHPEPYRGIDDEYLTHRHAVVHSTSGRLLSCLDRIAMDTMDPVIRKRILRVRTYVEFFRLYVEAFNSGMQDDMDKLINYIGEHPDEDMVLMYPAYFKWRNQELFSR
jgi:hypothetical protein